MVWQTVQGKNPKFNHWPNPSKLIIKDLEVLACGPTWQAKATYAEYTAFNFFFTNRTIFPMN